MERTSITQYFNKNAVVVCSWANNSHLHRTKFVHICIIVACKVCIPHVCAWVYVVVRGCAWVCVYVGEKTNSHTVINNTCECRKKSQT